MSEYSGFSVPDLLVLYHFTSKKKAIECIREKIEKLTERLGELHRITYMVLCSKRPEARQCLQDLEKYVKVLQAELAIARDVYNREHPCRKRKREW